MRSLLLMPLVLAASALPAQTHGSVSHAAATITAEDVTQRINVIADDSMMGRDTPSRGLDLTAQYVADQFRKFGLQPGGENGTYFQRYAILRRRFLVDQSSLRFSGPDGTSIDLPFASSLILLAGSPSAEPVSGPVTLVSAVVDPAAIHEAEAKDQIVVWVLDMTRPLPANRGEVIGAFARAGARAFIIASNRDSAQFAAQTRSQASRLRTGREDRAPSGAPLIVEADERAIVRAQPEAASDFSRLRSAPTMTLRPMPEWQATITIRDTVLERATAPNTIGILPGSDPKLRAEYVFLTAHMDHVGISAGAADSINNGADDDGSGTVGVVELAEAFSRGARPRRSIAFMTVSGEEKGLWGSDYFTTHPTVPLAQVVADLNLDMIGRNWQDTIVAIGKEHSDLGRTLNRVNAAHPELRMTAIDDIWPEERFYFRSDHYNFARKGVPILFFFNGVHADYHRPSDSPDKIEAEKESRILRLVYYLAQDVADAPARPQWNPESYKQIVEGAAGR